MEGTKLKEQFVIQTGHLCDIRDWKLCDGKKLNNALGPISVLTSSTSA